MLQQISSDMGFVHMDILLDTTWCAGMGINKQDLIAITQLDNPRYELGGSGEFIRPTPKNCIDVRGIE